ncbi:hypothetical protein [Proteiniclasticum sp.]|uniref:McrC family protein n=1 Tax=Proteiniclasticum sp. TaxID=2053595 RepID=UPI0025FA4B75|nr:hypothetical protein [Proteiniclasticum sp.]
MDGSLKIIHYVGFISKGNTCVQILPKIYEKSGISNDEEIKESMAVLYKMIRYSSFNKVLQLPEKIDSKLLEQDLLEIFIEIFADKVFRTYSSRMYREYIEIDENSSFIRGKIKVPETIRENLIRKDKHIISYQSFEQDNVINNVVKTVILRLLGVSKSKEIRAKLKKALLFLEDARKIDLSLNLLNSVRFTRLNKDFKTVYEMARMFFLNLQPQNYEGEESVFSFLVPVNELFEQYLYKLFQENGKYQVRYQNKHRFAYFDSGDSLMMVRPDIILEKDGKTAIVVDAKYKNPGYENGAYKNINSSDLYQVYAYSRIYGVDKVALIYPSFDEVQPVKQTIVLKDVQGKYQVIVYSVDLKGDALSTSLDISKLL